jgi:hypothetical protein
MSTAAQGGEEHRPPRAPWIPLTDSGRGYLSVYYSEPLARYPIREITRPADNKSDPNIETLTYGLFSTCERSMRNCIVRDGVSTLFFVTTPARGLRAVAGRAITGYYTLAWYTEGTRGAEHGDWALAASAAHFVDPIPFTDVVEHLPASASRIRNCKPLDAPTALRLKAFVDRRPDRTLDYLRELARIEQFARSRTGYAYPSWGRANGFTWQDAPDYYRQPGGIVDVANSSPSGRWTCSCCTRVITNAALLKRCPVCQAAGTLSPYL